MQCLEVPEAEGPKWPHAFKWDPRTERLGGDLGFSDIEDIDQFRRRPASNGTSKVAAKRKPMCFYGSKINQLCALGTNGDSFEISKNEFRMILGRTFVSGEMYF